MSGGSYNYLCFRDRSDISLRDLMDMQERLTELGEQCAAQGTQDVIDTLSLLQRQIERMHTAWHAVEWLDSSDYGLDQTKGYLREWEAKHCTVASHMEIVKP